MLEYYRDAGIRGNDRRGTLRFAALESEWGRSLRTSHPELENADTVVWVEGDDSAQRIFLRSEAALRLGLIKPVFGTLAVIDSL